MTTFGKQMSKVRKDREQLDPADFTFQCEYYVGPNPDIADAYCHEDNNRPDDCWIADMAICGHCGTHHFYGAVFKGRRDDSYINIGCVCAAKFFGFKSKREYYKAQAERAKQSRERKDKAKASADAFLADHPELVEAFKVEHWLIQDIYTKLYKYGSISDRQIELVLKVAKQESEKQPEPEPQPIPASLANKRSEFTGTILGYREKETMWGYQWKMLFRDDRGFKLWGSVPDGLNGIKGQRATFTARLTISEKDPCFGFYSRPTKATSESGEGI